MIELSDKLYAIHIRESNRGNKIATGYIFKEKNTLIKDYYIFPQRSHVFLAFNANSKVYLIRAIGIIRPRPGDPDTRDNSLFIGFHRRDTSRRMLASRVARNERSA